MAESINEMYAKRGLENEQLFSQFNYYRQYGIVDQTRPTEQRLQRDFKGIFFRCLEMRADAVSDALTKVFIERQTGQNEFEEVEVSHPWYQLIKNPSKIWSAKDVWKWAVNEYDLTGRADFIIERDNRGMPYQLLPVYREFGYIEIAPSPEGGVLNWVLYRSDGEIIPIERQNVLRIDRKAPWSPYQSVSLIEAARFELDTNFSMKDYRKNSVRNGGFSSPIVTSDQDLGETAIKQVSADYKKFIGNRGLEGEKVLIMGSGMKPVQPINARDLEYIQGEIQTDKTLMMITGVPPGMFENVTTRATADAAQVVFAQYTINPIIAMVAEQMTHQFEIIFDADPNILYVRPPDVVPLDAEFELRRERVLFETGRRTINDYLREKGEDEIPEGDKRYIPLGLTEISEERPEPNPERQSRSFRTEEERAMLWRTIDKKKRRQAELTKPVIREFYEEMKKQAIDAISSELERSFSMDLIDDIEAEYEFMRSLAPEVLRLLQAGFTNGLDLANVTGLEFPLGAPYMENTLKTILERQSSVPHTLQDELSKVIREGVEGKLSRSEMIDKVGDFFDDFVPGKVENIANGLSTSAWESGQHIAYQEAGIESQQWLSSRDGKERPTHAEADGQTVGINQFFAVGSSELKYPGDANGPPEEVIGCRCITLPV